MFIFYYACVWMLWKIGLTYIKMYHKKCIKIKYQLNKIDFFPYEHNRLQLCSHSQFVTFQVLCPSWWNTLTFMVFCKRGTCFPSVKWKIQPFNINIFLLYFLSPLFDFHVHQLLFVCYSKTSEHMNDHERLYTSLNAASSKYLREI